MKNLRPNGQRAKNAITLIWVILALEIISFISSYFQYDLLQTAANGGEVSTEWANTNDKREQILGIIYLIASVISAMTFIQWFRRAYYNLNLKVGHLAQTEDWAAIGWFVPFICLYTPYLIMKELYQKTKELLDKNGEHLYEIFSTRALGWWWALWIINNAFGQFVFRYSMKAESIEELTTSTIASMVGNIIGIPLALITIKIIKDYSNVEPHLLEQEDEETTAT